MKIFGNNEKNKKKNKLRLPLSAYLTYLLIATLLITGVSFSKYATTNSADDGARVASVILNVASNEEDSMLSIDTSEEIYSASYTFSVSNFDPAEGDDASTSEVGLRCTITLKLPAETVLPEGMTIRLVYKDFVSNGYDTLEEIDVECAVISDENNTYVFEGKEFSAYVAEEINYELIFEVSEDIDEDLDIGGISLSASAEQID